MFLVVQISAWGIEVREELGIRCKDGEVSLHAASQIKPKIKVVQNVVSFVTSNPVSVSSRSMAA